MKRFGIVLAVVIAVAGFGTQPVGAAADPTLAQLIGQKLVVRMDPGVTPLPTSSGGSGAAKSAGSCCSASTSRRGRP